MEKIIVRERDNKFKYDDDCPRLKELQINMEALLDMYPPGTLQNRNETCQKYDVSCKFVNDDDNKCVRCGKEELVQEFMSIAEIMKNVE